MVCAARLSAGLLGFACLLGSAWLTAGEQDQRFDIYWIDVEGGAATLMVTPQGESVLVDTGNPGRRDPDRIARVAGQVAGLRRIDHLVTTHFHTDHFGGASTLATMIPIKTVYDNGVFDQMPDNPGKAYFSFKAEKRVVIQPGDHLPLTSGKGQPSLRMTCLGARKTFIPASAESPENEQICADHKTKERDGSDNANSVVLLIEFGPFRFYDGADLTWNQEMRLVCPRNLIGEVDVYQVTHHGLDSSNNPVVLRTIKPTVAVMNNGTTKGCLPEVYANLTSTPSIKALYQLHKNLRPDGAVNNVPDEFIANRERDCKGNYIKLSVDPDGESYTVSIPAQGHEKTYRTKQP